MASLPQNAVSHDLHHLSRMVLPNVCIKYWADLFFICEPIPFSPFWSPVDHVISPVTKRSHFGIGNINELVSFCRFDWRVPEKVKWWQSNHMKQAHWPMYVQVFVHVIFANLVFFHPIFAQSACIYWSFLLDQFFPNPVTVFYFYIMLGSIQLPDDAACKLVS